MKKILKTDVDLFAYSSIETLKDSRIINEISKKVNDILEIKWQKTRASSIMKAGKMLSLLFYREKKEPYQYFYRFIYRWMLLNHLVIQLYLLFHLMKMHQRQVLVKMMIISINNDSSSQFSTSSSQGTHKSLSLYVCFIQ